MNKLKTSKMALNTSEKYSKIAHIFIKICLVYVLVSILFFVSILLSLVSGEELGDNVVVLGISTFVRTEDYKGSIFFNRQFELADHYLASTMDFPGHFNPTLIEQVDVGFDVVDLIFLMVLFVDAVVEIILIVLLLVRADKVLYSMSEKKTFFPEGNRKDLKFICYGTIGLFFIREISCLVLRLVAELEWDLSEILNPILVFLLLIASYVYFEKQFNCLKK